MKKLKKICLKNVSDIFSDSELKRIIGGGYTGWCCTVQGGLDYGCSLVGCTSHTACESLYGTGSKCS